MNNSSREQRRKSQQQLNEVIQSSNFLKNRINLDKINKSKKVKKLSHERHSTSRELFFAADMVKEMQMAAKVKKERKAAIKPVLIGKRKTIN